MRAIRDYVQAMKVFISWSGGLSKQVAELLGGWIEDVLQGVEKWISTEDIDKGSIWFKDISKELEDTSVGVLCITRENVDSPWVLFEAGALSKGLAQNRVCPLLVNLEAKELKPPLSHFNATRPIKEDMRKLVGTINAKNAKSGISPERVKRAFETHWKDFEGNFSKIVKAHKPAKIHQRPQEEMIIEILGTVRSMQRWQQDQARPQFFGGDEVVASQSSGLGSALFKYFNSQAEAQKPNASTPFLKLFTEALRAPLSPSGQPENRTPDSKKNRDDSVR